MSTVAEKRHMEVWKPAPSWEGFYEVSDLGSVRSTERRARTSFGERSYGGKTLRPIAGHYLLVNLTAPGRRSQVHVHTLVLTAFVGQRPEGKQACHGNGNRHDARLANLRWDTVAANSADKKAHGTSGEGERNPNARLTEDLVRCIRASTDPVAKLAQVIGVSKGCIEKARYGATWKHVR